MSSLQNHKKYHVFISYSHGEKNQNEEKVKEIRDYLELSGISCYLDLTNMGEGFFRLDSCDNVFRSLFDCFSFRKEVTRAMHASCVFSPIIEDEYVEKVNRGGNDCEVSLHYP